MSEFEDDLLQTGFENAGYDVEGVSHNRGQVRISLREEGAAAAELREVLYGIVPEEDVLGLDITAQGSDAEPGVGTVISFRHRG